MSIKTRIIAFVISLYFVYFIFCITRHSNKVEFSKQFIAEYNEIDKFYQENQSIFNCRIDSHQIDSKFNYLDGYINKEKFNLISYYNFFHPKRYQIVMDPANGREVLIKFKSRSHLLIFTYDSSIDSFECLRSVEIQKR